MAQPEYFNEIGELWGERHSITSPHWTDILSNGAGASLAVAQSSLEPAACHIRDITQDLYCGFQSV